MRSPEPLSLQSRVADSLCSDVGQIFSYRRRLETLRGGGTSTALAEFNVDLLDRAAPGL
jgi:hypothetical protein